MKPTATASGRGVRLPALDGLRAIAVAAVLLYHSGYSWAKGGYLGVDLFFVLSGFLVTGLIIGEQERTDTVSLRDFWIRRIRRLMPAQITLILVLLIYVFLFHRPELYELRGQVLAALGGVTNWYLIASDASYFTAIGRPPVLRHLWSLAIEMQFYLLWPLVLAPLARVFRRQIQWLLVSVLGGALFSAVLMAVLFRADNPSTAYYSTFTRLSGLLLGAGLAIIWQPRRLVHAPIADEGPRADKFGLAALAVAFLFFGFMSDQSALMYRGGFVIFSLISVVLVAVASHPTSWLSGPTALGHPMLVAIGGRSYGIYLWHWPVFAYTWPGIDNHLVAVPLLVLRLAVTGVLSELCFRFVEKPWHSRQMTLRDLRRAFSKPDPGEIARPVAVGVGSVLVLVALAFMIVAPVHKDEIVRDIEAGQEALANQSAAPPPNRSTTTTVPASTAPGETTTTAAPTTTTQPPVGGKIPDFSVDGQPPYVTAFGDSVMVGAGEALLSKFDGGQKIYIDAAVARQAKGLDQTVASIRDSRGLGDVVLIHIGTNGTFTESQIRATAEAAGDTPIVFMTAHADRVWISDVNETLARVVPTLPHAYLIDWYAYSRNHPEWFGHDGIHLTTEGRQHYADIIYGSLTGNPPA